MPTLSGQTRLNAHRFSGAGIRRLDVPASSSTGDRRGGKWGSRTSAARVLVGVLAQRSDRGVPGLSVTAFAPGHLDDNRPAQRQRLGSVETTDGGGFLIERALSQGDASGRLDQWDLEVVVEAFGQGGDGAFPRVSSLPSARSSGRSRLRLLGPAVPSHHLHRTSQPSRAAAVTAEALAHREPLGVGALYLWGIRWAWLRRARSWAGGQADS
jgi:hypothetical protein